MIFREKRSKLSNHEFTTSGFRECRKHQYSSNIYLGILLKHLPVGRTLNENWTGTTTLSACPVFNDNALIVICWKRFIEVWRVSTNGICELTAFSVPKLIRKRSRKTTVTHKQIEKISGDFASMRSPHANGLKWTLDGYQWKITKNALQSHC